MALWRVQRVAVDEVAAPLRPKPEPALEDAQEAIRGVGNPNLAGLPVADGALAYAKQLRRGDHIEGGRVPRLTEPVRGRRVVPQLFPLAGCSTAIMRSV